MEYPDPRSRKMEYPDPRFPPSWGGSVPNGGLEMKELSRKSRVLELSPGERLSQIGWDEDSDRLSVIPDQLRQHERELGYPLEHVKHQMRPGPFMLGFFYMFCYTLHMVNINDRRKANLPFKWTPATALKPEVSAPNQMWIYELAFSLFPPNAAVGWVMGNAAGVPVTYSAALLSGLWVVISLTKYLLFGKYAKTTEMVITLVTYGLCIWLGTGKVKAKRASLCLAFLLWGVFFQVGLVAASLAMPRIVENSPAVIAGILGPVISGTYQVCGRWTLKRIWRHFRQTCPRRTYSIYVCMIVQSAEAVKAATFLTAVESKTPWMQAFVGLGTSLLVDIIERFMITHVVFDACTSGTRFKASHDQDLILRARWSFAYPPIFFGLICLILCKMLGVDMPSGPSRDPTLLFQLLLVHFVTELVCDGVVLMIQIILHRRNEDGVVWTSLRQLRRTLQILPQAHLFPRLHRWLPETTETEEEPDVGAMVEGEESMSSMACFGEDSAAACFMTYFATNVFILAFNGAVLEPYFLRCFLDENHERYSPPQNITDDAKRLACGF